MVFGSAAHAEDDPIAALIQLNKQMIESVKDGDIDSAQQTFETFKAKWKKKNLLLKGKSFFPQQNGLEYRDDFSFFHQSRRRQAQNALEELSSHLETYQQAVVLKKTSSGQSRASLTAYIQSLKDTKQLIQKTNWIKHHPQSTI